MDEIEQARQRVRDLERYLENAPSNATHAQAISYLIRALGHIYAVCTAQQKMLEATAKRLEVKPL